MPNSTPNLGDSTFCGMAGYKASAKLLGTQLLTKSTLLVQVVQTFEWFVVTVNCIEFYLGVFIIF